MADTLAVARARRTQQQIFEDLAARIKVKTETPTSPGLDIRVLSEYDYRRVLPHVIADTTEGADGIRADIVEGGILDLAKGPWLTLLAAGFFSRIRREPQTGRIQLRLTDTTGSGTAQPITKQLVAVFGPDLDAPLYYRSQAGQITLPPGGFRDVVFDADGPGAIYNVPPNTISQLTTPVPGVAVSSPPIGDTGTIVLVSGADEESDEALRQRALDRWASLRRGWSEATIRGIIQDFAPEVTRSFVRDDGPLPGEAWAYVATATGTVDIVRALEIQAHIGGQDIRPQGNRKVRVIPAKLTAFFLPVTLYTDGRPDAEALASQRLAAFSFNYPLGRLIYRGRLVETFVSLANGVYSAELPSFPESYQPAASEVVQFIPLYTTKLAQVFS